MNTSAADVADVPPALVTVTSTGPADSAGETTVNEVALTTVTADPAVAPKATVDPGRNPVPVTVTAVPPAIGPDAGTRPETVGTLP